MGERIENSVKVSAPSTTTATEKLCRHRQRSNYCQLGYTNKCCACVDKTRRFDPNSADAQVAAAAVVSAATSTRSKYADYCPGCVEFHSDVAAQIVKSRVEAFRKWSKKPHTNPERTKLHANYVLRRAGLPFEITHLVLAFTLKEPLVNFFRFFDKEGGKKVDPGTQGVVVSAEEARKVNVILPQHRAKAQERSARCPHTHCPTSGIATSTHYDYTKRKYVTTTAKKGCCACRDARPNPNVDVMYIDGRGDVLMEVDFYIHYCRDCKDHWQALPGQNPHNINRDETSISPAATAGGTSVPSGTHFVSNKR